MDNKNSVFISFLIEKDPDLSITVRLDVIEAIEQTADNESIIYMGQGRECLVKESKEEVLKKMSEAYQKTR